VDLKALIFDCDGVLADTERFAHLPAFNATFREFGLKLQWSEEEYGRKLQIAGGKERTVNGYTEQEDFSEAVLVVSSLGEPGTELTTVRANHSPARPRNAVTLADLEACLRA
jgi:beta-phosphoglucomutase-like phosphatase (HAD superfamily)